MTKSFNKSQMLKLSLIAALLVITPLLSTSLRPTYFYFIFNLLIIALGVEAGLLSSSKPQEDKKTLVIATPPVTYTDVSLEKNAEIFRQKKTLKVVEKCSSEKIVSSNVMVVHKIKKCPSTPSLFFIGGSEMEAEEAGNDSCYDEEEFDEVIPSGQELFNKAETFIGNFYKQLKMQREESWKRIHGFYHKAF